MQQTEKARGLADAAAYLCSAYEELMAAGYEGWSRELRMLMEIIDAEIDWLRTDESSPSPTADW
jgi:hypothetical protein